MLLQSLMKSKVGRIDTAHFVKTLSFRPQYLNDGAVFRLSPGVVEAAADLLERTSTPAFRKCVAQTFLPAPKVWMENVAGMFLEGPRAGDRIGLLLEERDNGMSITVFDDTGVGRDFAAELNTPRVLASTFRAERNPDAAMGFVTRVPRGVAKADGISEARLDRRLHPEYLAAGVFALLALINAPKTVTMTSRGDPIKNKRRAARGRAPMVVHKEVTLNIGAPAIVRRAQPTGTGAGMPLHSVMAHLRLRYGRAELVSFHWRGSPENGVVHKTYFAKQKEESDG